MSYTKYNIFELTWPEPPSFNRLDIVWWKKGIDPEYWYKAESPVFGIICLGDTKEEAVNNVIKELEDDN